MGLVKTEEKLALKHKIPLTRIDQPLPKLNIGWRPTRKGRSRSQDDKRLSLNNIPHFAKNGCYILSIEGSPDDHERLEPIFEHFWKSGKARHILGRRCKMVMVFSGAGSYSDRSTTQRLRRFSVQYEAVMQVWILPHVENINKRCEVY